MNDPKLSKEEARLIAYFDGELSAVEAKEVEATLAGDPASQQQLQAFSRLQAGFKQVASELEAGVDFDAFYDGIAVRLGESPAAAAETRSEPTSAGLLDRMSGWFTGHPAFAAAATVLVVLGTGSLLYLNIPGSYGGPMPELQLRSGVATIEDLSFSSGSAVVYKTEGDLTVIWLTDEEAN